MPNKLSEMYFFLALRSESKRVAAFVIIPVGLTGSLFRVVMLFRALAAAGDLGSAKRDLGTPIGPTRSMRILPAQ